MKLSLIFMIASALAGQSVSISVKQTGAADSTAKTTTLTLRPQTVISSVVCTPTKPGATFLDLGDTAVCLVTLNQAAPVGGFPITITLPSQLTGPTAAAITAGTTTASFQLIYSTLVGALVKLPLFPTGMTVWGEGMPTVAEAMLLLPCCAQADHCGLPLEQIALEPCA